MMKVPAYQWLVLSISLSLVGCRVPISRQLSDLRVLPETSGVSIELKEMRRGKRGGAVGLLIRNHRDELLHDFRSTKAVVKSEIDLPIPVLSMAALESRIAARGPRPYGFEKWSRQVLPIQVEPLDVQPNLQTDEEALVWLAFEDDGTARKLQIDMTACFAWMGSDGRPIRPEDPIRIEVELPSVTSGQSTSIAESAGIRQLQQEIEKKATP